MSTPQIAPSGRPSRLVHRSALGFCLRVLPIAALTVAAPALWAQTQSTGVIEGRVQNATSGLYLENARVSVTGTAIETFTDASGRFRLSVPAGKATVEVFFTGLARHTSTVDVTPGSATPLNVVMDRTASVVSDVTGEKIVELDPFVVASNREYNAAAIAINEQRFAANKKEVVSTDAFGEINQGNIGEFVKHLPGISFELKDGNNLSGIMVRGFNSNYTNVTFNGAQLASAALSNTQNHTRQFVLEQANINNVARIEVVKLPTPDMQANLLGGAVNFISRNAFESPRRQISVVTYLNANEKALELDKTPGPGRESTYKIRPALKFTYLEPFSDKFGFTVAGSTQSQYYERNRAVLGRRYSGSGASLQNPQTTNVNTTIAGNLQANHSGSVKFDWKPLAGHTFSLSGEAVAFSQFTGDRTINHNVGNGTPVAWGENFIEGSTGSSGTGTTSLGNSFQERHGLSRNIVGQWYFDRDVWHADASASFSHSASNSRDTAKGFFRGVSTALRNVRSVNLRDIDNDSGAFGAAEVRDAAGNPIDFTTLANYNLTTVQGEPQSAEDTVLDFHGRVGRDFDLPFHIPLRLTLGGSSIETEREIDYSVMAYTYVGPDGVANSGDETMAPFADPEFVGTSPGFGRPGVQWPSPYVVYDYFQRNPGQFTRTAGQQGDTVRNRAVRSPLVYERLTAGYIMGDTKLFRRVRVVGGLRYELTENWGWGFKQDSSAVFQRDAQGNLIKVNGAFVRKPEAGVSGSAEEANLIYTYRGQHNERDYSHLFPSVHTTTEIFENLQLRAAYAETIGRPRMVDVVPSLSVSDNATFDPNVSGSVPGFITSSNTTLKPWTAKNYDLALEYYLPNNGSIAFNVFRKDVRDFFSNVSRDADQALLDELGLPASYVGYRYTTRVNVGDARIEGWEASLVFPLANLPQLGTWGKYFTVRGNLTHLSLTGSRVGPGDFGNYTPRSRNFGVSFANKKLQANFLVNYKGKMLRDTSSAFTNAREYIRSRLQIDADVSWQLHQRYSLFAAVRNLTNEPEEWEVSGPDAPGWAALTSYSDFGAQYSLGVKATF
jgi:iron complex outermembrane recepter protein